jgi:hypothetical protein
MIKFTNCKLVVFQTGERFPVLVGDDGLPVSLPMRYVVLELRQRLQWRSIEAYIRPIGWSFRSVMLCDNPQHVELV